MKRRRRNKDSTIHIRIRRGVGQHNAKQQQQGIIHCTAARFSPLRLSPVLCCLLLLLLSAMMIVFVLSLACFLLLFLSGLINVNEPLKMSIADSATRTDSTPTSTHSSPSSPSSPSDIFSDITSGKVVEIKHIRSIHDLLSSPSFSSSSTASAAESSPLLLPFADFVSSLPQDQPQREGLTTLHRCVQQQLKRNNEENDRNEKEKKTVEEENTAQDAATTSASASSPLLYPSSPSHPSPSPVRIAVVTSIMPAVSVSELILLTLTPHHWCVIVIGDTNSPADAQTFDRNSELYISAARPFDETAEKEAFIQRYPHVTEAEWNKLTRHVDSQDAIVAQYDLHKHVPVISNDKQAPDRRSLLLSLLSARLAYFSLSAQLLLPYSLVSSTPSRSFARKNLGFLLAIHAGASVLFDFDDDNIYAPDSSVEVGNSNMPFFTGAQLFPLPPAGQIIHTFEHAKRGEFLAYDWRRSWKEQLGSIASRREEAKRKIARGKNLNDQSAPSRLPSSAHYQVWNPYPHYGLPHAWPRGFPLSLVSRSLLQPSLQWNSSHLPPPSAGAGGGNQASTECVPIVQQYLANVDPDVDSIYRLTTREFEGGGKATRPQPASKRERESMEGGTYFVPFSASSLLSATQLPPSTFTPFNAQATIFLRGAFWSLLLPQSVHGRVTDIWRSYFFQVVNSYALYSTGNNEEDRGKTEKQIESKIRETKKQAAVEWMRNQNGAEEEEEERREEEEEETEGEQNEDASFSSSFSPVSYPSVSSLLPGCVVFLPPHILHSRNSHSYSRDFDSEQPLFQLTATLLQWMQERRRGHKHCLERKWFQQKRAFELKRKRGEQNAENELYASYLSFSSTHPSLLSLLTLLYFDLFEHGILEGSDVKYIHAFARDFNAMQDALHKKKRNNDQQSKQQEENKQLAIQTEQTTQVEQEQINGEDEDESFITALSTELNIPSSLRSSLTVMLSTVSVNNYFGRLFSFSSPHSLVAACVTFNWPLRASSLSVLLPPTLRLHSHVTLLNPLPFPSLDPVSRAILDAFPQVNYLYAEQSAGFAMHNGIAMCEMFYRELMEKRGEEEKKQKYFTVDESSGEMQIHPPFDGEKDSPPSPHPHPYRFTLPSTSLLDFSASPSSYHRFSPPSPSLDGLLHIGDDCFLNLSRSLSPPSFFSSVGVSSLSSFVPPSPFSLRSSWSGPPLNLFNTSSCLAVADLPSWNIAHSLRDQEVNGTTVMDPAAQALCEWFHSNQIIDDEMKQALITQLDGTFIPFAGFIDVLYLSASSSQSELYTRLLLSADDTLRLVPVKGHGRAISELFTVMFLHLAAVKAGHSVGNTAPLHWTQYHTKDTPVVRMLNGNYSRIVEHFPPSKSDLRYLNNNGMMMGKNRDREDMLSSFLFTRRDIQFIHGIKLSRPIVVPFSAPTSLPARLFTSSAAHPVPATEDEMFHFRQQMMRRAWGMQVQQMAALRLRWNHIRNKKIQTENTQEQQLAK